MKKIIVTVTTDLVTDQRVHKVSQSLHRSGYNVLLVGRKKSDSMALAPREYSTKRFKLLFERSALFYINYNLRLFVFLLFNKADILLSNDLDTLLPVYLVSQLKRIPIVYDNHEYFTATPELAGRPFVTFIWKLIEKSIFPNLKYVYTVNDSIKELFEREYNVGVEVIRNIPLRNLQVISDEKIIDLPKDKKIIIYQGSGINKDRGAEELVESMQYLEGVLLLIVGSGDVINILKQRTKTLGLQESVIFVDKVPFNILKSYTSKAHLGLAIDKDTNINYKFSLPNKLFDYIHAGVPILATRLVEIEKIITKYNIGGFIESHNPVHIAETITKIFHTNEIDLWKQNLSRASNELCWENEEMKLLEIFKRVEG